MTLFPHIRFAGRSDIGRKRKNNEDAFGLFPKEGIFCVSDGMGGGDDGEVASAATIKAVEDFCTANPLPAPQTYAMDDLACGIGRAIGEASGWIYRRTQEKNLKGCGATFVGVCLDAANPSLAMALHAGDSRLYRIRGRGIQQITKDHSAAELIGAKNESDVNPMFRGMILRAVGVQPTVEIERTPLPLKPGDRILICSDGLSRMVPDKKILSIVRANSDLDAAVDALIAAANAAGGIDNITAVMVELGELPAPVTAVHHAFAVVGDNSCADGDSATGHTGTGGEDFAPDTGDTATGKTSASGVELTASTAISSAENIVSDASMSLRPVEPQKVEQSFGCKRVGILVAAAIIVVAVAVAVGLAIHERSKAAELRRQEAIREEARIKAEEAKAKAEAERKSLLEERARLEQEIERRKAEAKRKAEAEAEAKRKAEAEAEAKRKAEAEAEAKRKAEIAAQEAAKQRQGEKTAAVAALVASCTEDCEKAFLETVRRYVPDGIPSSLEDEFKKMRKLDVLSSEPAAALAEAMTVSVQAAVNNLAEYVGHYIVEELEPDMIASKNDAGKQDNLRKIWHRLRDKGGFLPVHEKFCNGNPADVATQRMCADVIRRIPEWFPKDHR